MSKEISMTHNDSSQRRSWARVITAAAMVATLGVGLGACSRQQDEPQPSETAQAEEQHYYAPLTGVEIEQGSLDHAAVTVKIPNAADGARPQVNLNKADLIYEEQVEGNITRYVTVYHSQLPKVVGPVRSARPTDVSVVSPISGAFVYSGLNSEFASIIGSMNATQIDENNGTVLQRDSSWGKKAPNNLFADPSAALSALSADQQTTAPAAQYSYAEQGEQSTAAEQGDSLTSLSVTVGSDAPRSWAWSADLGKWVRSTAAGQADVTLTEDDASSAVSEQIAATNLVVIQSPMGDAYNLGSKGLSPRYLLDGQSGSGYVLSDGKVIDITWSKADATSPFVLVAAGTTQQVLLSPGNTWISLVPQTNGTATVDGRVATPTEALPSAAQ